MGQLLVCAGAQSRSPGRPAAPLPGGRAALPAHWARLEGCSLHLPSALCLGTAPRSRRLRPAAHVPVSLLPSCVCFLTFQEAPSEEVTPSPHPRTISLRTQVATHGSEVSSLPGAPGMCPSGHRGPRESCQPQRGRRGADEGRDRGTKERAVRWLSPQPLPA